MKVTLLPLVALAASLVPNTLAAQSYNIDVEQLGGAACLGGIGAPAPTYGAAARLAGPWNTVIPASGLANTVQDTAGLNPVVITNVAAAPLAGFCMSGAGPVGDDAFLLDDGFQFLDPSSLWTVTGLAEGDYDIYTYAWHPSGALTNVTAYASSTTPPPLQLVGGMWPGQHALTVTYALNSVSIQPGDTLHIDLFPLTAKHFGAVGGFQIVRRVGSNGCFSSPTTVPATGAPNVIRGIGSG